MNSKEQMDIITAAAAPWPLPGARSPSKSPLTKINEMIAVQTEPGTLSAGEYMRGMANGLICARAVLDEKEPVFIETPAAERASKDNVVLREGLDKTDWVQKQIHTFPVQSLGRHRADVLHDEINRLRRQAEALRPYLGTIESALREYASTSRDIDEQLDARKALAAVADAQRVTL